MALFALFVVNLLIIGLNYTEAADHDKGSNVEKSPFALIRKLCPFCEKLASRLSRAAGSFFQSLFGSKPIGKDSEPMKKDSKPMRMDSQPMRMDSQPIGINPKSQSESTPLVWGYKTMQEHPELKKRYTRQTTTKKYKVYMEDLESVIYIILYFQVPLKSELAGKDLLTLIEFLKTCSAFFPLSNTKVRKLVKGVLDDIQNRQNMSSTDFRDIVRRHNNDDPITGDSFVTCKDDFHNVACGLWLLFNTFTTQAYATQAKQYQDRDDVLTNIANYISYFNPDMAKNIQSDSETFPYDLKESVLWLWKVQNEARNRDYPNATVCPECHNCDGSWNDDKLFEFILSVHQTVYYKNGSEDQLWD